MQGQQAMGRLVDILDKTLTVPVRFCPDCGPAQMVVIEVLGRSKTVPVVCEHLISQYERMQAERERLQRGEALNARFGSLVPSAWKHEAETMRDDLPGIDEPMRVARLMVDTLGDRIANGDGLLFQGTPGNGKSFLSKWVAREASRRGHFVIWVKIKTLCDFLRDWDNRADLIRALQAADLLVLDELVHSSETRWTADELMGLVDARHNDRKSTVITTNFNDQAIVSHYLDILTRGKDGYDREKAQVMVQRFISRLQPPRYERVRFTGPDYRLMLRDNWTTAVNTQKEGTHVSK